MTSKIKIRKFDSGAVRDTSDGKLDYYGFRHPLIEQKFAEYMNEHRRMKDGSLRDANNWWKGWPKDISLQSMVRHVEDLQALHAGAIVFELQYKDGSTHKVYLMGGIEVANDKVKEWDKMEIGFKWITVEDCLSAIRFNCGAYLLDYLKN